MTEPQCIKVDISVQTGGQVQIVKFNLSNNFSFGYTESYTVPADWDEDRLREWIATKTQAMKDKVDGLAQAEQDSLLASSDWYDG